ncbi:hypothetical protein ILP92_04950 [Maribius pontilimi]|uniref:Uncharacterized protein n=1 Tax=Palleronia pontilimi TaxID=1964209 RepID=A0A934MD87_9RHOB|nr:hypothetical protein [Palleronia pontilimi]MBJ3762091.1 hypothetical protein [Palleronia pontilimi]
MGHREILRLVQRLAGDKGDSHLVLGFLGPVDHQVIQRIGRLTVQFRFDQLAALVGVLDVFGDIDRGEQDLGVRDAELGLQRTVGQRLRVATHVFQAGFEMRIVEGHLADDGHVVPAAMAKAHARMIKVKMKCLLHVSRLPRKAGLPTPLDA